MTLAAFAFAVTTLLSLIALFLTVLRYRLKIGVQIRGSYTTTKSIDCDDIYVSAVILENLKDRAVTIFGIYLKIGSACYLELDDFKDSPHVLKAFETFHKEYGPVLFYDAGGRRRILVNDVMGNDKVKKRLVLSTSHGRYIVPTYIPSWSPISDFFRNYMTALAQPVRLIHRGKAYGSNIKYLIEFERDDSDPEVVAVHCRDFRTRRFRRFQLTEEAMESKASLETFLAQEKDNGNITARSFKVYDLEGWRKENFQLGEQKTITWSDPGKLRYHMLGWIFTKWKDRQIRRENKARERKRKLETQTLTKSGRQ